MLASEMFAEMKVSCLTKLLGGYEYYGGALIVT